MYLADEAWPDLEAYFQAESLAIVPCCSVDPSGTIASDSAWK